MISISEKEFVGLSNYIKNYYGIDLTKKKGLIEGRLNNTITRNGFNNLTQYLEYVFAHPKGEEAKRLISKLTTNHTYFMREPSHFAFFKEQVLPYYENTLCEKDLRIWSAGCSTGEEPYTLAMIIDEYFGKRKSEWDTQILATDISTNVLEQARNGVYSEESLQSVSNVWKLNYLKKISGDNYEITDKIKRDIIFRGFNLMDEVFPFKKKFNVIFCRNVMIYFDVETKVKLINKFYECTEPGGYLFIGHSESLNRNDSDYKYIMPSVYRKG